MSSFIFLTEGEHAKRNAVYGITNYFLNGGLRKMFYMKSVVQAISVLISSMCTETGTLRLWENDYHYPRVSPGAHPLIKTPEDSGHKLDTSLTHLI